MASTDRPTALVTVVIFREDGFISEHASISSYQVSDRTILSAIEEMERRAWRALESMPSDSYATVSVTSKKTSYCRSRFRSNGKGRVVSLKVR